MSALIKERGKAKNDFGWAIDHEKPLPPDLPYHTPLRITDVRDSGVWGSGITLTVVNPEGKQWFISDHCFEPRLAFSFDDGKSWYREKHWKVQHHLMDEFCKAEAAFEQAQALVNGLRWFLERNGTDSTLRQQQIEGLRREIAKDYGYKKPSSRLDQYRAEKHKNKAELQRLLNGAPIRYTHPDCDEFEEDYDDGIPF